MAQPMAYIVEVARPAAKRIAPGFGRGLPYGQPTREPNLKRACIALFIATVLLMLARVVPLPGWMPVVGPEVLGLPVRVLARIVLYTVALVLLFASYVYALYCVRHSEHPRLSRFVLLFTGLLTVPAILNPDLYSNDVYGYIFYGRMVEVHGLNPYVTLPSDAPSDPFLGRVDWRNLLSPYGPLWTTWSALINKLVPGGVYAHVLAFKVAAALTHLLNAVLVGAIVRKVSPQHSALSMAVYGWNPLPLTEFAGNAHNDSLMLLGVLGALFAYFHRRAVIGAVLLGIAIAIKFTAALFVPLYVFALVRGTGTVREKVYRLFILGIAILSVWFVSWIPYMSQGGWRRMYTLPPQSAWYLNSLPAVAYNGLRDLMVWVANVGQWNLAPIRAGDLADTLVRVLSAVLILTVGLRLARRIKERSDLVEVWFWFLFAYLFFIGPYFWPWYATTLVSLAAISRRRYVWLVTTVLSLTAMAVYSCSNCRSYFRFADSAMTGLFIFLLPLLALALLILIDTVDPDPPAERLVKVG